MVIMLSVGVLFAKQTIESRHWIYDFHDDRLGTPGRIALTALPDNTNTHISCGLAEDPDIALYRSTTGYVEAAHAGDQRSVGAGVRDALDWLS